MSIRDYECFISNEMHCKCLWSEKSSRFIAKKPMKFLLDIVLHDDSFLSSKWYLSVASGVLIIFDWVGEWEK